MGEQLNTIVHNYLGKYFYDLHARALAHTWLSRTSFSRVFVFFFLFRQEMQKSLYLEIIYCTNCTNCVSYVSCWINELFFQQHVSMTTQQ